jgi:hypothetical protein
MKAMNVTGGTVLVTNGKPLRMRFRDVDYPPGWTPATPAAERPVRRGGRWSVGMIVLVVLSAVAAGLTVWNAWHLSVNVA